MFIIKSQKKKYAIFIAVCFTVMALSYIRTIAMLPSQITLIEGEEFIYRIGSPFSVKFLPDKEGMIEFNSGSKEKEASTPFTKAISLKPSREGSLSLTLKAFGFIPLKSLKVDIVPNISIYACGNTVGVKLHLDGIMIIGLSEFTDMDGKRALPAKDEGLKAGDIILEVNNKKAEGIDFLLNEVQNCEGKILKVKYKRGDTISFANIQPKISKDDKKYRLGMWCRDSTAGIGTLTFIDKQSGKFGALGHGITDVDTGALMPVLDGEILESDIIGIKKGKAGSPGELKGVFIEDKGKLGLINTNSEGGIYGTINKSSISYLNTKSYPIALRSQIKEGPATILSNISGKTVEEYSIEIQKVSTQNLSGTKGMIIKITDERLLSETGGIVQGMSGSPIIQNNKIVGAVTHVLVNDPTRGYGIFIEGMLKSLYLSQQIG